MHRRIIFFLTIIHARRHLFICSHLCLCRDSWISTWSPRLAMPRAKYSTSRWRVTTIGISQKSPLVKLETVRIDLSLRISLSVRSFSWEGSKREASSRNTRSYRLAWRCDRDFSQSISTSVSTADRRRRLKLNLATYSMLAKLPKKNLTNRPLTLIASFSTAFDYASAWVFECYFSRMNIYSILASTDASVWRMGESLDFALPTQLQSQSFVVKVARGWNFTRILISRICKIWTERIFLLTVYLLKLLYFLFFYIQLYFWHYESNNYKC